MNLNESNTAVAKTATAPVAATVNPTPVAAPTKDLAALVAEKAKLDKLIEDTRNAERSSVIVEMKLAMENYGITTDDLNKPVKKARAVNADGSERKPVPAKYKSEKGETWTGRGKQPTWVTAALAGGLKLEDLLIEQPAPKTAEAAPATAEKAVAKKEKEPVKATAAAPAKKAEAVTK